MPPRTPQRGLTMLEMLVVLMLVALLGTLVIQGLAFFVRSYDAVTRDHRTTTHAALRQHWFVTAVSGIVPYGVQARAFAGDTASFVAMTLQALNAEPGMPTQTRWSINIGAGTQAVSYAEDGGTAWRVLESDAGNLAFQYADSDNRWHDRWPIAEAPTHWTPKLIRLTSDNGTIWLAAVEASPEPTIPDILLR